MLNKVDKSISNIDEYLEKMKTIVKSRNKINIFINNIFMELENSNIKLLDSSIINNSIPENDIKYTLSNVEYNINDLKKFIEYEKLNSCNFQENIETLTHHYSNIIKKYNLEIEDLKNRMDKLELNNNHYCLSKKNKPKHVSNLDIPIKDKNNFVSDDSKNRIEYNRSCGGCLF